MPVEGLLRGPPFGLFGAAPAADVLGNGVALGDDGLGLLRGDRGVVDVAELVGGATVEHPPATFGEFGRDHTAGFGVSGALVDHLVVIDGGELGVESPWV
ncbi:MAG: hypothetical protein P1T08_09540 [Acidimicrobiia bacterium]|nr:hypothetical protein [Acidimicrobiia bacterium]